ncbi:MAG: GerW family sporulation protein [Lachnospiraceae bacterium]|nr:GerW family sporulation protein [Lachnospiraceae bacterium]
MGEQKFSETVAALFKGMDSFITTKTVVGDAVRFDDGTIILPLVDVSFGVGAGAFAGTSKNSAGGGMGGKITPNSVLVIKDGMVKLVSVNNQDKISKILDSAPDVIDKVKNFVTKRGEQTEMTKKGKEYLDKETKKAK